MAIDSLRSVGVLGRMGAALLLVLATFNPSGISYYHWLTQEPTHPGAARVIVGVLLLIGWVVYVTATKRSLGLLGVSLLVALFAALLWLLAERGWLQLGANALTQWIALIIAGLILGVGMCWSFVRRALSGQADVDQVDNR
jgi:hypothetical protein